MFPRIKTKQFIENKRDNDATHLFVTESYFLGFEKRIYISIYVCSKTISSSATVLCHILLFCANWKFWFLWLIFDLLLFLIHMFLGSALSRALYSCPVQLLYTAYKPFYWMFVRCYKSGKHVQRVCLKTKCYRLITIFFSRNSEFF